MALLQHLQLENNTILMKAFLIFVLFCFTCKTYSQTDFHIQNFKEFNSYFQKLAKGNYKGYASGILEFEDLNGNISKATFSRQNASLKIVPDTQQVYDISRKEYLLSKNDVLVKYCTYNFANALYITIGSNLYTLSLFDGWCSDVIKGLDYEYIQNETKEYLILNFSERVGLCITKRYTAPVFFVNKGSTLIFCIEK